MRDIEEWEFNKKFTDTERQCFYETLIHSRDYKKPFKVFRFIDSWRFILRVQPNMITKVRIKDLDLERRYGDIQRYFQFDNRRDRLFKLLHGGSGWRWDFRPKAKYKNPLANRSFADIIDKYHEEPVLRTLQNNPRETGGFSFLEDCCFLILLKPDQVFESMRPTIPHAFADIGVNKSGLNFKIVQSCQ